MADSLWISHNFAHLLLFEASSKSRLSHRMLISFRSSCSEVICVKLLGVITTYARILNLKILRVRSRLQTPTFWARFFKKKAFLIEVKIIVKYVIDLILKFTFSSLQIKRVKLVGLFWWVAKRVYHMYKKHIQFKGVIQSKKTFDMCYQKLREPHRHQQN